MYFILSAFSICVLFSVILLSASRHLIVIREIKIYVYAKRQKSDLSGEFLRIEIKQIKTVQSNSFV